MRYKSHNEHAHNVVLTTIVYIHVGARQAVVNFNARGITGNITFTELTNGSIRIQTYLKGLRGSAQGQALCIVMHNSVCIMWLGEGVGKRVPLTCLKTFLLLLSVGIFGYNHLKFYLNFDVIL